MAGLTLSMSYVQSRYFVRDIHKPMTNTYKEPRNMAYQIHIGRLPNTDEIKINRPSWPKTYLGPSNRLSFNLLIPPKLKRKI